MSTFLDITVRSANALTILYQSLGVLNKESLNALVIDDQASAVPKQNIQRYDGPGPADIATILFRVIPTQPPGNIHFALDDIRTMCGITSSFARLGQSRKHAFLMRGVALLLLPALIIARKAGAAEMGVHPAASLTTINETMGNGIVNKSTAGNGVLEFLKLLCATHGIHQRDSLDSPNVGDQNDSDSDQAVIARIIENAVSLQKGSMRARIEVLRLCVNICEALPSIQGVLWYSAETLRAAGTGRIPEPDSPDGIPLMAMEEQIRLHNNISRTISLVRHKALTVAEGEYWNEFLVRGVDYFGNDRFKALTVNNPKNVAAVTSATKNPFIHDALAARPQLSDTRPLLVVGEEAMFRTTLQNVYEIDLIIERIKLVASGVPVDCEISHTHIGPCRAQTILLSATPRAVGELSVEGCLVKVQGCRERRFPVFNKPWSLNLDAQKERKEHVDDQGASESTSAPQGPEISKLLLKVILAQPNVVLQASSLPESSVMLLDGEIRRFDIQLLNVSSDVPADLLLLSFDDSATAQSKAIISDQELTPLELYELEYSILHRPALILSTEENESHGIPPNGCGQHTIEVLGKPGLSTAEVRIDFTHLGSPLSQVNERFYTRNITIPLMITVNASVELVRNDILPITLSNLISGALTKLKEKDLENGDSMNDLDSDSVAPRLPAASSDVLLVLDFRNSWPTPLMLTLKHKSVTSGAFIAKYGESVAPGHVARVPLAISKFRLPTHDSRSQIPSLQLGAKKQYVVSSSGTQSPAAEIVAREIFWYRQRLLDQLQAEWEEEGTRRKGYVNLRSLRLSTRMLDILRLDDLEVSIEIKSAAGEDEPVSQMGKSKYLAPLNTFITCTISLQNRSLSSLQVMVGLNPYASHQNPGFAGVELSRGFVWNGTLRQRKCIVRPEGIKKVCFDFCLITEGSWHISANAEEIQVPSDEESTANSEDDWAMKALAAKEKRTWRSEDCEILTHGSCRRSRGI